MTDKTDEEITQEINDLLEIHVAPMVAQHGGSVTLESYKDGVATMFMSGACAGCASSNATIKYGVQNMLISVSHRNAAFLDMFKPYPAEMKDKAEHLLEFVGLYQKRKLSAGDLSFGQQKLLEFAMALMNDPEVLLLDEPTAGINPTLINGLLDRLHRANTEFGITLFVIEHNMRVVMNLADNIYCLAHGELLAHGTPDEIQNDQRVIDAYLGAH